MMIFDMAGARRFSQLALLGLGLVAVTQVAYSAPPGNSGKVVLRVAKDKTAEYASIQAAIEAAPAGATIRVGPGVYEENLRVRKPLILEGAGWSQTTIAAPHREMTAALGEAMEGFDRQYRAARTEQEKKALAEAFLDKYLPPALLVQDARGVQIRGLKITASDPAPDSPQPAEWLAVLRRSQVQITDCAVVGSPSGGLSVVDGSDVEIRRCLVAAVWDTGITVGEREAGANVRATIADCDVRNCHYAGICIRPGSHAVVERCRISGAAWHGIRYDDSSPTIVGNLISANARCGIYASGKTAATVKQNLFLKNEINGMSCWFGNCDTIAENTFAGNVREALSVIGDSQPRIERNIFFGHPKAITCGYARDKTPGASSVASPTLPKNLFWKNGSNVSRANPKAEGTPNPWEDVPLGPDTASVLLDPGFTKAEAGDYSLSPDSPARREGIGVVKPLELASPWPLQPEERAIIPDGPSRDSNLWKKPAVKQRPPRPTPESAPKPPAGPPPPIVLLYHNDPAVRIRTIEALAATRDPSLIDDLIRAHAVEFYTPVHNAYFTALRAMTGQRVPRGPGAWKSWLAQEAAAGRLKIDYLPLQPDALPPDERAKIQPLVAQLGPEHLDRVAKALAAKGLDTMARSEALRYLVANDHREDVQKFLQSDWLVRLLALDDLNPPMINALAYVFSGLADPGPLRERVNAQLRECLDSKDPIVLANTLHVLAGVEGFSTVFVVPDVAEKVRKLLDHPAAQVAAQARRAMNRVDPKWAATVVPYEEALVDLYETLGREYPCFVIKGIDWKAVGKELLPRAKQVKSESEFGLLCLELVARLEDSHAQLGRATASPPVIPLPRYDSGFACLLDDRGKPVVYHVDRGGPAEQAGVRVGMTVLSIQGKPAEEILAAQMKQLSRYIGYSSDRFLRYHAAQFLPRQMERGAAVALEFQDVEGKTHKFSLPAALDVRYLPRLPVPIPGIRDSGNVSWALLPVGQASSLSSSVGRVSNPSPETGRVENSSYHIGYIYVRRIQNDLLEQLDRAVGEVKDARGLVIDVRGNSGGGFDAPRAHRNFALDDKEEPDRPRFRGPIALLIDSRCISAGEGWASWFVATKRARLFGEATAGASSRKKTYTLKNGLYTVTFPIKAYTGFLDRPIERRGLEPDVPLRQNARDLAAGRDTVLEAAKRYILEQK